MNAVVIGAGPAGLAVAASLQRNGVPALVLERGERIGTSWRAHYDRLRLNTVRWLSGLPGMAIPARMGRWVARDDFIAYLERYATHHALAIRTGIDVERIERNRGGWSLRTSHGTVGAASVVVATGYNDTPYVPAWPGADRFPGPLLHSRDYRNAESFRGRDVLVVGVGSSGAEIAADLARGGAARVRIAVRRGPTILGRDLFGIPTQLLGALAAPLPPRFVDEAARRLQRFAFGDLTRHGLPAPARGLVAELMEGRLPVIDTGFCAEVAAGRVEPVAAVAGFDGADVLLAGGMRVRPDAVVAATGFRRNLMPLAGDFGVVAPSGAAAFGGAHTAPGAPGLYFIGLTNDVEGSLFEIARAARTIARAVTERAGARSKPQPYLAAPTQHRNISA